MGHFNACQLLKLQNWDLSKLTPPSNYLSSQINITVRHELRQHITQIQVCVMKLNNRLLDHRVLLKAKCFWMLLGCDGLCLPLPSCLAWLLCVHAHVNLKAWHTVASDQSPLAFPVLWLFWGILLHRPSRPGVYRLVSKRWCVRLWLCRVQITWWNNNVALPHRRTKRTKKQDRN